MGFNIETAGSPIPPPCKYPFHLLKVGQSIRFDTLREFQLASIVAHQFGTRNHKAYKGWRMKTKKSQLRIWRIA